MGYDGGYRIEVYVRGNESKHIDNIYVDNYEEVTEILDTYDVNNLNEELRELVDDSKVDLHLIVFDDEDNLVFQTIK